MFSLSPRLLISKHVQYGAEFSMGSMGCGSFRQCSLQEQIHRMNLLTIKEEIILVPHFPPVEVLDLH